MRHTLRSGPPSGLEIAVVGIYMQHRRFILDPPLTKIIHCSLGMHAAVCRCITLLLEGSGFYGSDRDQNQS